MKKRVGIIIDSTKVSKQISDLIALSKTSRNYEIKALVINKVEQKKDNIALQIFSYIKRRGLRKFLSNIIFKAVCKVESTILKRLRKFNNYNNKVFLEKEDFVTLSVSPQISKSGLVYHYGQEDLDSIKELQLNLLIRGCGGILRGGILDVCQNGVISFHHADNNVNRGGPPGFWEVYYKSPRTGFIIQRLKEELDGGDVLYKGFVSTSWFYSLNLANLYEVANPFLHKVIEEITSENSKLIVYKKSPYSFRLFTTPNIVQTANYLLKTSFILASKIYIKLQGKRYRWSVAYQFSKNWNDVALWRSKRIANPKNRYLAHPFLIKTKDNHYCFVEDFDYKTNKGSISAYRIANSGYEPLGVVLEEDFHLSYPFIFRHKNNIFICPETREKNEIRLYKCVDFPYKWEFHKTLMKDIYASGTIIFERNNKWWLFTNIEQNNVHNHGCQLHIFSSDSPLSDKWIAHKNNPVIFDPLVARNGGIILSDNEIYRVFQRHGFDQYGEACGIARILTLSSTEYVEEVYSTIEPNFFENIKGVNTYNYLSELIVLDYVEICKTNTGI